MKHLFFFSFLFVTLSNIQAQRFRNEPPSYVFRVGGMVTHLTHYKVPDNHFYKGFNLGMELPIGKKWSVGFGYGQSIYKDVEKPYGNSVAYWQEHLNMVFTDFKYYFGKRYKGVYVGALDGLMLKKVDALVPLENDVLNRQIRIPFSERLNSFALGVSSGYVFNIKDKFLLTFEGKLMTLRYEWAYQFGVQCGYKFQ